MACSAQKALEDTALYLVNKLHEMTGEENLCMAGGVAFNSVMNGRIFHEIAIQALFCSAGGRRCGLFAWGGDDGLEPNAWKSSKLRHGPCLLGARVFE